LGGMNRDLGKATGCGWSQFQQNWKNKVVRVTRGGQVEIAICKKKGMQGDPKKGLEGASS